MQAAQLLNLKRTTLIEKLKRLEPRPVKPMPPRHTYWTIILEGKPTAFRAATQEELLPTFKQIQASTRRRDDVVRARPAVAVAGSTARAALARRGARRTPRTRLAARRASTRIRASDSRSRATKSAGVR